MMATTTLPCPQCYAKLEIVGDYGGYTCQVCFTPLETRTMPVRKYRFPEPSKHLRAAIIREYERMRDARRERDFWMWGSLPRVRHAESVYMHRYALLVLLDVLHGEVA
jgi:hypothetical protein